MPVVSLDCVYKWYPSRPHVMSIFKFYLYRNSSNCRPPICSRRGHLNAKNKPCSYSLSYICDANTQLQLKQNCLAYYRLYYFYNNVPFFGIAYLMNLCCARVFHHIVSTLNKMKIFYLSHANMILLYSCIFWEHLHLSMLSDYILCLTKLHLYYFCQLLLFFQMQFSVIH